MPDEVLLPAQERTKPSRFDDLRCRPFAELRLIGDPISNRGGRLRMIVCIDDPAKNLGLYDRTRPWPRLRRVLPQLRIRVQ